MATWMDGGSYQLMGWYKYVNKNLWTEARPRCLGSNSVTRIKLNEQQQQL